MLGLLRKIMPGTSPVSSAAPAKDKSKQHEGQAQLEADKKDYEAFVATFQIRPGVTLMSFLKQNGLDHVMKWLHWMSPYPEARAFIKTELLSTRNGNPLWVQPSIGITVEGPGPKQESHEALEMLAKVLGKQINLRYRPAPGAPYKVMEYDPTDDGR